LSVHQPKLAVALLGVGIVAGIVARSPVSIAVLALPVSFNTGRLSIGHGIALPDIVLLLATILSLPALARLGTPQGVTYIRRWFAVYGVAMAVIVVLHPSGRSIEEAFHRTILVVGALNVGAWIYLEGKSKVALRLLLVVASVVGLICIIAGAAHGFHDPAQPLSLNKNYVGSVLGLTLLVVLAAPDDIDVPPKWRYLAMLLMGGGLVATHSRAAMLALVIGILVWFFRTHSNYRKRSFIIAVIIAAAVLTYAAYLLKAEVANKVATQNTNSVAVRNKTESATIALWRTSPIVGVGIYYYNDPAYQEMNKFLVAPTNLFVEALAEGGIVLFIGLAVFNVGALSVLFRYRNPLAVAGLALVADRLAHGLADIFWTAGDASLPWIIVGMGLAQAAVSGRDADPASHVLSPDLPSAPVSR